MTASTQRHEEQNDAIDIIVAENVPRPEPSWFFNAANQQPRDILMERYRQSRRATDYGTSPWHQPIPYSFAETDGYRSSFKLVQKRVQAREATPRKRRSTAKLVKVYLIAGCTGILIGSFASFVLYQFGTFRQPANKVTAAAPPLAVASPEVEPVPKTAGGNTISKKSVDMAELRVSDVSGHTNSLIPLALHIEPAIAQQDLLLKLSGLPDKAYLTSGTKGRDQVWALTLADIKDVKLMVPGTASPKFEIAVAAFERQSGDLAAPIKTMTVALTDLVVRPAAAPPPQSFLKLPEERRASYPSAIPKPDGEKVATVNEMVESENLVARGDTLLKSGDPVAARTFYRRAWSKGVPQGAFGLARSYDPFVHAEFNIAQGAPDAVAAIAWYERASAVGNKDAREAIARLVSKP